MGYCVDISLNVVIPADKVPGCLAAINAMHEPAVRNAHAAGGRWGASGRVDSWYAWVDNPPVGGFETLVKAFDAWRYEAVVREGGDVELDYFDGEKWGDDEQLFRTIAPFVRSGGEIRCVGEDDEAWGYRFRDGELVPMRAERVWAEG